MGIRYQPTKASAATWLSVIAYFPCRIVAGDRLGVLKLIKLCLVPFVGGVCGQFRLCNFVECDAPRNPASQVLKNSSAQRTSKVDDQAKLRAYAPSPLADCGSAPMEELEARPARGAVQPGSPASGTGVARHLSSVADACRAGGAVAWQVRRFLANAFANGLCNTG
jgi:hypothetical protein